MINARSRDSNLPELCVEKLTRRRRTHDTVFFWLRCRLDKITQWTFESGFYPFIGEFDQAGLQAFELITMIQNFGLNPRISRNCLGTFTYSDIKLRSFNTLPL